MSDETREPEAQPEEQPVPPTRGREAGLPLWMPLGGLMVAFVCAVLAGALICPTLSALVFPPEPPLPPGDVNLVTTENKGTGLDEWVYTTKIAACSVYKYYMDRVGNCNYDPDARCGDPGFGTKPRDGASYLVGVCQGTQSIGLGYKVIWTVRIGGGYPAPNTTTFRITREVSN